MTPRSGPCKASLGINEVLCRILVQRGITTFDRAKNYFRPNLADLHDPWLMKDMDKACRQDPAGQGARGEDTDLWGL